MAGPRFSVAQILPSKARIAQFTPRKSGVSATFPLQFSSSFAHLLVILVTVKMDLIGGAKNLYRHFYRQSDSLGADRRRKITKG
jgi:hypothetical protein